MIMKKLILALTFGLFGFGMVTGDYVPTTKAQTTYYRGRDGKLHKRWSKRKKNAVIGGVGGAVVGAAVSRHKVKGALIGGAVGTGAGYLFGRHKDKKSGLLPRRY
jgi:uncharacterized membrane protein YsdA (DUF1294 family)